MKKYMQKKKKRKGGEPFEGPSFDQLKITSMLHIRPKQNTQRATRGEFFNTKITQVSVCKLSSKDMQN